MSLFGGRQAKRDLPIPVAALDGAMAISPARRDGVEGYGREEAERKAHREEVRLRIVAQLQENGDVVGSGLEENSSVARGIVKSTLEQIMAADRNMLGQRERDLLIEEITAEAVGLGPLEELLSRDDISEIMVNTHREIWIEQNGKMRRTSLHFRDEEALLKACKKIVDRVGRRVDNQSPLCDARLEDGSRVNVAIPPIAVDGTHLTIRKFRKEKLTLSELVEFRSISPQASEALRIFGRIRVNVLISGGTGSGKTTMLNCLTGSIEPDERVLTCEDTAELQLQGAHVVRLETRPPSAEANGAGEVTMADLVRNGLRMKPHRIIVGEVRDDAAVELVQAMNTGHMGSMGTIHANDPRGALSRMEALIRTRDGYGTLSSHIIRQDISESLDLIVQTQQLPDGRRVVTHITEVGKMEGDSITLQDLFKFDFHTGRLLGTGVARPMCFDKAGRYGEAENLRAAILSASEAVSP